MGVQRIAVVTDSTADLPPDVQEKLDIPIIPLTVLWGGASLKDGVDIDALTFYQRLQVDKDLPTTSQPSAGEFVDFFRRVAEEKGVDTIVGVFLSSALSGTVSSAKMAQEMLTDLHIEVVDSLSASMGLGFQAMAAAEAAQNGASVEDVLEEIHRVRYRHHVLFLVDTLEFLHRGGRIGGARRFLGTALRVKPLLHLLDGKIEPLEQVRTKKRAIQRLLEVAVERKGSARVVCAAAIHAHAPEEGWLLQEEAQGLLQPQGSYLSTVSPVLGTHTGPGALGLILYTD
ncbi:MAG: DegV family protein [Anaerolineae bacterium]|nr:DegV family protein [Anaerolineae bacterium]